MNLEGIKELMEIVPQTYGEAIKRYPWMECEPHEWDNCNTIENATYIIRELLKKTDYQSK